MAFLDFIDYLRPSPGFATDLTLEVPGGVGVGDILVGFILVETGAVEDPLAGWTPDGDWTEWIDDWSGSTVPSGQSAHVFVLTQKWTSGASWVFSWTNSYWAEGICLAYEGDGAGADFVDVAATSASAKVNNTTTIDWSDTITYDDARTIWCVRQFAGGAFTGPGNERFDPGAALECAVYDQLLAPGASGTKTFTSGGTGAMQVMGVTLGNPPTDDPVLGTPDPVHLAIWDPLLIPSNWF